MLRKILAVAVVVAAAVLVDARPADAAPLSPRNPYRSFNITGVNYGSLNWERTHGGRCAVVHRGGGWLFRRR